MKPGVVRRACTGTASRWPRRITKPTCARDGRSQQQNFAHAVRIFPEPGATRERRDYFDNRTLYFGIHESHRSMEVIAESEILVRERERSSPRQNPPGKRCATSSPATASGPESLDAHGFVFDSPYVSRTVEGLQGGSARPSSDPLIAARRCRRPQIYRSSEPRLRHHGDRDIDPARTEVVRQRRGVCQDFAHFRSAACARWDCQPATSWTRIDDAAGELGCGSSAADVLQYLISTYLPERLVVDFDPVNDLIP